MAISTTPPMKARIGLPPVSASLDSVGGGATPFATAAITFMGWRMTTIERPSVTTIVTSPGRFE